MLKKSATLLTVMALGVTAAACGGGDSGNNSGSSSSPSPSSAPTAAATNKPKPELRMLMQYDRIDPNQDYTGKKIIELTGYPVKYEMLPAENQDEKLNLLVANQDSFDVMKLNAAQFFKLATTGALEPLDELIEKHGPNIKNAIGEKSWESAKINGKMYAIPETGSGIAISEELIVRQDWLDELQLKVPTNTDELYTVLKTFKEKKNVIPLVGSKDSIQSLLGDIAGAFGVTTDWVDEGGALKHQVETPQMKEFLTYMNKLYSEGLIDSELPLNTSAKAIEKFSGGKAAMYKLAWYNAPKTINALTKSNPDAKVSVIPFLKKKDGNAKVYAVTGTTWFAAVPKYSKNKEEAVKFLDAKLDPKNFKELAIGVEGTHHTQKEGKYFPILPKFNEDLNYASGFMTGVDEKNYPIYWQARVRKDPILTSYYEKFQENAKGMIVTDPIAIAPPINEIAKNKLKLNKLQLDNMLNFITGTQPMSQYDAFVAKWKAEGGDEMTKGANNWYKAQKQG